MNAQVALVTGASRGIGRAIAMRLAADGYTVIGTATTETGAESISAAFTKAGGRGQGIVMDVTDVNAVDTQLQSIAHEFDAPTVLVNNAGITRDNLLMRMKDEEWQAVIETNLTAVYRLSKACLRAMMKARNGRIVNISSVVGSMGNAGQANYAATKAGIMGFSKSLAREVGARNITVNVVAPGFIDTDMTRVLPDEQKKTLVGSIPLSRLGSVEEVAHAVAFLCSPQAGYITGETLHVNGGMHMA